MMKTSVKLLALVLFLYIHSAVGLQCWFCGDDSCFSQTSVTCSSEVTHCATIYNEVTFNNGNDRDSQTSKGCASPSLCTAAGSESVSFNYGSSSYIVNTTCCDSDNCNKVTPSITAPPVGSLKCYICDPFSYQCTANVSCRAQEVCGQAVFYQNGTPRPFYSCVSENLCNDSTLSQRYFGDGTPVSCCNTSNCNVPDLGTQCMTCTDSCSSRRSVTCSKFSPLCFSVASAASYSEGNNSFSFSEIRKGCASASDCAAAGPEFVSYDYGSRSYLRNVTCCDTDGCNTPDPPPPPAGSLQCYGYDSRTKEVTANVTCTILETCSFISNGTFSFYGCISENLCNNLTLSQRYFPNNSTVTCCNTNYCNVPQVPPRSTDRPLITTEDPPDSKEDEDGSVFSGAVQVLSPALVVSLLLCVHMFNFMRL